MVTGRDSHIEWSKAETGMTMSMPDFLIDAQCGYHFHKIMTDIHVAKPVVICSSVAILGIQGMGSKQHGSDTSFYIHVTIPFSGKNATIYKHFDYM